MEGLQSSNHVKLMLYFDEAHVLAGRKVTGDPEVKDTYDALCSCFNSFLSFPIFVIYLLTNSNMSQPAPSRPLASSAWAYNYVEWQAPVAKIPFDCSPVFPIIPGKLGLDDVCGVEFMAQFGCPMWVHSVCCRNVPHDPGCCRFWTLLAAAGNHKDEIFATIVNLARVKLIDNQDILARSRALSPNTRLAVVDILFNLDFEPQHQVTCDREVQLVASHMRITFWVPKEREYFRSGYPSKPLLAEAAAHQIHHFQTPTLQTNVMLKTLVDKFTSSSGLLDQGQRGEVVFCLLLLEATSEKTMPMIPPTTSAKAARWPPSWRSFSQKTMLNLFWIAPLTTSNFQRLFRWCS